MAPLCYGRHRSLPEIIQHAIWLYFRFTLSLPRCRGAAGRTRARYLLRNGAPMGAEVRPRDRTKTGRLWVYTRDDRPWAGPEPPAAVYFYSPDRPASHLGRFKGILQGAPDTVRMSA